MGTDIPAAAVAVPVLSTIEDGVSVALVKLLRRRRRRQTQTT
jgi:hypothetical protein